MSRNVTILVGLVLLFVVSGSVSALDCWWTNTAGDRDWNNALNWDNGVVPTTTNERALFTAGATAPDYAGETIGPINGFMVASTAADDFTISSTTDLTCRYGFAVFWGGEVDMTGGALQAGQVAWGPGVTLLIGLSGPGTAGQPGVFNMSGGVVSTAVDGVGLGSTSNTTGIWNMSGGTANIERLLQIGTVWDAWSSNACSGILNMTGGVIDVNGLFDIGTGPYTLSADVSLDGGLIEATALLMGTVGSMDITGGTLILDRDRTSLLQGYVTAGQLSGYGVADLSHVLIDYDNINPGQTTVTAIPEPVTFVLLGLGGLLLRRRRK
jgi:hypothetical protein